MIIYGYCLYKLKVNKMIPFFSQKKKIISLKFDWVCTYHPIIYILFFSPKFGPRTLYILYIVPTNWTKLTSTVSSNYLTSCHIFILFYLRIKSNFKWVLPTYVTSSDNLSKIKSKLNLIYLFNFQTDGFSK